LANTLDGLFETVVAAGTEASRHLSFTNLMLERIYMQYKPEVATLGQTLNVNVPTVDEETVTDIGAGDLSTSDTDHDTVPIVFDKNPSTSFVIRDFEQVRTPVAMRELYVGPRLEALIRKVNRSVAALVTEDEFDSYSAITGGADIFTKANLAAAWNNLVGAGVPVSDGGNLFFTTHNLPYSNMLQADEFSKESTVGVRRTEAANDRAVILPQFNAQLGYDQTFPTITTGVYAGLLHHRYAIAMRTALLPAGDPGVVREATIFPKPNLPVRLQVGYSQIKQGWVVSMNCPHGIKVVRPDHGSFMKTT
jgi:hypothetical protein